MPSPLAVNKVLRSRTKTPPPGARAWIAGRETSVPDQPPGGFVKTDTLVTHGQAFSGPMSGNVEIAATSRDRAAVARGPAGDEAYR
jgi:hypothetical protein